MPKLISLPIIFLTLFCNCKYTSTKTNNPPKKITKQVEILNPKGKTIFERFNTPNKFERIKIDSNSFGHYLRNLPLKKDGEKVYLFNKKEKAHQNAQAAVIDLDIGNRDLQQCADATIRLRAEYLFAQKKYKDIHFNFTDGFNAEYSKWRKGFRISVKKEGTTWTPTSKKSISYDSFRHYLNMVFAYAGTASLEKELKKVALENMQIGDVFIQGGFPGHAVIVVDMAINKNSGKKIFMLAQSYMPAQDIHVLRNPNNMELSPWYDLDFGEQLITPEWKFRKDDLKRF